MSDERRWHQEAHVIDDAALELITSDGFTTPEEKAARILAAAVRAEPVIPVSLVREWIDKNAVVIVPPDDADTSDGFGVCDVTNLRRLLAAYDKGDTET